MCVVEARHLGSMGPFSKKGVAIFESTLPQGRGVPRPTPGPPGDRWSALCQPFPERHNCSTRTAFQGDFCNLLRISANNLSVELLLTLKPVSGILDP